MFYPVFSKFVLLILGLIQSYNEADVHFLEDGNVVFGGERAISVGHIQGSGEGDELAGQYPVQVSVLDLLEVLVLLDVECRVVVPAERDGELQPLEAVQVDAFVRACSHRGVSIGQELVLVGPEGSPCVVSCLLEDDDHEGTHQERGVCLLCIVERRVMVNLVALILRVIHEFFQLLTEEVHLSKV